MRDTQLPPTNDPTELANRQIELLIAERYITEALAATPPYWEDRFRNLDATARVFRDPTPSPDPNDLWTAKRHPTTPGIWHIIPPRNNPNANHPDHNDYIFTTTPDGRRAIAVGPIGPHELPIITAMIDRANAPIINKEH